jgi:chitodextrinase
VSLNGGETLTLLWSGSAWYAIGGTAILSSSSSSFGSSIAASGYQRLPSGLIMQWGSIATVSGGSAAVTFPLTFPTAVYTVNVNVVDSAPNTRIVSPNAVTTSGFSVTQSSQSSSTAYWTALGK